MRTQTRVNLLFRQFTSNSAPIGVAAFDVVNGHGAARGVAVFSGDRLTKVGTKRCNAALVFPGP